MIRQLALINCLLTVAFASANPAPPNVILCMADDLGWGDTGYNGSKIIHTPHLDTMAAEGVRFDRFYAASAVCSPTRASVLTGRHPHRTGVFYANTGILRPEELTIAEFLNTHGYATGHFGKWHLGTFTTTRKDANRGGPRHPQYFNPPDKHGFDTYFSTESKVPTWDPMLKPARYQDKESAHKGWRALTNDRKTIPFGTAYWSPDGPVSDNLRGDDSRVIMDRVIPFIRNATKRKQPFLAVIWFHAPHLPCVAGPEYAAMYKDQDFFTQQYAGCITAIDDQMGRLRKELIDLGIADNTMLCFTSDNGPENNSPGSTGGLSERKRSLKEGGIRVPGLMVWPNRFPQPLQTNIPVSTSDYFPTIAAAIQQPLPADAPLQDGRNILPMLDAGHAEDDHSTAFLIRKQAAVIGPRFKLYLKNVHQPNQSQLFDITKDHKEQHDISTRHPKMKATMQATLEKWITSLSASFHGLEYSAAPLKRLPQQWPFSE